MCLNHLSAHRPYIQPSLPHNQRTKQAVSTITLSFFFRGRRRHTRCLSDWSSDVCSSDLSSPKQGRREPRPCFGELLHLDGSRHRWLALLPERWFTLIAVVDDATKRLLYAELGEGGESVAAIMTALRSVLEAYGVPMGLYTDRAHWAVHTPTSGSAPDRRHPTQVGRALARLGIEHILGYSPQARGRSERVNRTRQDRLVNELRLAGVTTVAAANRAICASSSCPASMPNSAGRPQTRARPSCRSGAA